MLGIGTTIWSMGKEAGGGFRPPLPRGQPPLFAFGANRKTGMLAKLCLVAGIIGLAPLRFTWLSGAAISFVPTPAKSPTERIAVGSDGVFLTRTSTTEPM